MRAQTRLFLFCATVILAAAALLRLVQLHVLPPGPHYDEAVNLIVTRTIIEGGARPFPILEAYQGREVLYFYLNAPFIVLIYDGMFTFHLTNAFANLITVAASMALGRLMFAGRRGVVIGLVMGVCMAIAFPQLWLARQAFRAVTLPLMQSLALIALWRGLRGKRRYGWLIAAGVLAGGALYTYNASRLFPLWLMIGALVLLIADRHAWRTRVPQGIAFFGAMVLTALPMGIYAIQRPDVFFNRLAEVTGAESITLGESILLHLKMFFIEGDPYLRYNMPGRPYMTLIEGVMLIAGALIAVWRLSRPGKPLEKAAYTLAILSPLMVIPSVISVGGLPPSHMRSLGMIPLIYLLVGIGFEALTARLKHPLTGAITLLMIGLAAGGAVTGAVYFNWAGRADLYYETDADLAAASEWAAANQQTGDILYVAAKDLGHPTFMIAELPEVTWIGTDSLIYPPPGESGLAIFPRSAPPLPPFDRWLEAGRIVSDIPLAPDLRPAFEVFRVGETVPLAELQPVDPDAPPQNAFVRAEGIYALSAAPGETLDLIIAWSIRAAPPVGDFTPLVQIEDANGFVLSRVEPYMAQTDRWRIGETFFLRVPLTVPVGTAPGMYPVRIAWVARAADQYQPYQLEDGSSGGIWATVGEVTISAPDQAITGEPPIEVRVEQPIAPGVTLLGWDAFPQTRRPGEALRLVLYWRADDTPDLPDQWRVLLGDTVLTESGFDYSPEGWAALGIYAQRIVIDVPRDTVSGVYPLTLEVGGAVAALGMVEITGTPRVFTAPPFETALALQFDDVIALHGYTLEESADEIRITFVWQALREMDADYTVFVHLIDNAGEIAAQIDAQPLANTYPTRLWSAGEFVQDSYSFPSMNFTEIRVGWYLQSTGVRLVLPEQMNPQPHDFGIIRKPFSG